MNKWRKQFDEHPLHTELANIITLLDAASIKTQDEDILSSFNRLIIVLKTFSAYVHALTPECTVKGFLDKLHAPLAQIRPQLEQFIKTENVTHLQSANGQADILVQLIPPFALPETAAQYTESIKSLGTAVEGLIASLSNQAKTSSESLKKIQNDMVLSTQRLDQLDKTIDSQKSRLDTAISEFQKQFSDAQEARRKEVVVTETNLKTQLEKFRETITNEIKNLVTDQKTTLSNLSTKLNAQGNQLITEMENKKNAAAKVLDVSTNVAVSGGYGKYASQEKIAAEVFRGIALIFMCALIYGAYRTIEIALHIDTIDWRLLAVRAITTFTLTIPAFYAVKESNKHRTTERRYRKMQLELAAVDPYLELLEKGKRDVIKEELSKRFFAQPEISDNTADVDANSLLDIIKQVITALLKK
ncbi:MAG: hypothetical protein WC047_03425 [Kiritimatiellales bacterium]